MLQQTAAQLGWTAEQCLQRVHTPVGLDLGGDSPEAVALAIVAEIQMVLHGRDPKNENDISGGNRKKVSVLDPTGTPFIPTACPLDKIENPVRSNTEEMAGPRDGE